jgi:hypothetical protein
VLAEGLRGAFKDDATLLMRLAEAHLEAGRTSQSAEALSKAVPEKSPDSQLQYALLQGRLAAAEGRDGEAETQLQGLIARRRSEGPRYYYAEFLLRRGTVVWRHQERAWFYAAKRLLKTPPAGSREPVPAMSSMSAVGG